MKKRVMQLGIVMFTLVASTLSAQSGWEASVVPAVRLGPLADSLQTEPAVGGSLSLGYRLPVASLRVDVGAGLYALAVTDERLTSGALFIPEIGFAWAPELSVEQVRISSHLELSYSHYVAWYEFDGDSYLSYRPIASAGGGAAFALTEFVRIGPEISLDLVFDDDLRFVTELGLQTRLVW